MTELSDYIASREVVLDRVRRLLRETMKLRLEPEAIDPDAPLFGTGLGMDSVDAVELVVQLDAVFGLKLAGCTVRLCEDAHGQYDRRRDHGAGR